MEILSWKLNVNIVEVLECVKYVIDVLIGGAIVDVFIV